MNDFAAMWDFPVSDGVTFSHANHVHPLMQKKVEHVLNRLKEDPNVMRIVLFGSALKFRCDSHSDIDFYITLSDPEIKLISLPDIDCDIDIVTNLSPDSRLFHEIDNNGLLLFERSAYE